MAGELPRIEIKPVVRHLHLVTIDDLLLEDTVSVTQTISPSRVVQGRKTVKEASSEPSKTTVTQSSIMLLLNDVLDAETKLINSPYGILSAPIITTSQALLVWANTPLATSFKPTFSMALSKARPMRNSRLK